jgi:hemerythrin superfamily protein
MSKPKDALQILEADHREVERVFGQYEELTPRALKTMAKKRDAIVQLLAVHAAVEEQVFYPVVIQLVPELEEQVLAAMQEHQIAERLLADVDGLDPDDRWFRPKMTVLIENVRAHVDEEESGLFPQVRDALDQSERAEIGTAIERARRMAPLRPHPHAPSEPPFNTIGDLALGVVDRVRATVGR